VKITIHTLYWLGVITLLTLFFGQESKDFQQAFYFATMLMPIAMGTSYFFIYYLIPNYLLKRRFWRFGLYLFYTLVFSLYLEMLSALFAFIVIANYQFENLNPLTTDVVTMGITISFIVLFTAFGQLLRKYFIQEDQITELEAHKKKNQLELIQVRAERKLISIRLNELCFIESLSDYVKIHTTETTIITKEKISKLERDLPDSFLRIHRSYLVNSLMIESFTKESVSICDQELPISRTYKPEVIKILMKD
jgi:two-component system response regulator LytT